MTDAIRSKVVNAYTKIMSRYTGFIISKFKPYCTFL